MSDDWLVKSCKSWTVHDGERSGRAVGRVLQKYVCSDGRTLTALRNKTYLNLYKDPVRTAQ